MFRADTQRRGNIHWILASPAVDFFFETTHFFAKPHFFEKPRCGLWLTSLQRSHSMPHQCNHGRGGPIIGDYIGESCVSTLINSDSYINTIMMEETMCRLRLQRNKYYAEHMSIFSITVVSQNSWRRTEKARRCESDLINLDVTTWLCLLLYKTCFSTRLAFTRQTKKRHQHKIWEPWVPRNEPENKDRPSGIRLFMSAFPSWIILESFMNTRQHNINARQRIEGYTN